MGIFLGIVAVLMVMSTLFGLAALMLSSRISREEEWRESWWQAPVRQEVPGD